MKNLKVWQKLLVMGVILMMPVWRGDLEDGVVDQHPRH